VHWLLIASMLALGGCVAAVIGGSGSGTSGGAPARSSVVSPDSRIRRLWALWPQSRCSGLAIAVAAGGAVTLTGTVRSSAQRAAAGGRVRSTESHR
jgi:osmotically-inducible protein OsmY